MALHNKTPLDEGLLVMSAFVFQLIRRHLRVYAATVVYFVAKHSDNGVARTKTTLAEINIIGSAESDPFLQLQRPKSLLCLPLISQKALQAVLYLHSYSVDAFKQEEREVLKVLSVQAAISLEKLSIYQELDRTNAALIELNKKVEEQSRRLADEVSVRTAELHEKLEELKLAKEVSEKAKDEAEKARLDALRSKDEAVKANHLKSTFLATMSHEIRTPFNAVTIPRIMAYHDRSWVQLRYYSTLVFPLSKQTVCPRATI